MKWKSNNRKSQSLLQLALFAGILLFVNILANVRIGNVALYNYLDLTEEKRFTLTNATRSLLGKLDEVVYVNVMLEGDFPAGFKRLQTATREILEDFRSESGFIEYGFEDPAPDNLSVKEINARRKQLSDEGIIPVNLRVKSKDGASEQLIYPYAVIFYKGRQHVINLLENEIPGVPKEVILNNSIGLLEYKLANAIQKLQSAQRPVVMYTTGHGELQELETADLDKNLRQFYEVGRLHLDSVVNIGTEAAALIIAKPRYAFSEKDNFKLDQYVMNGGKVLWLLDWLRVDLDSLRGREQYFPVEYPLNLGDLLFNYGARIQPNLVLDFQCSRIPLATGFAGNAPQFDYFKYPYHVVVTPNSKHPVAKNLGALNLLYPHTIDTTVVTKTPVQKTVLLTSSNNSMFQYLPMGMDFEFLRYDLQPEKFDKGPQPLAVLLEGEFPSMYENRLSAEMLANLQKLKMEYKPLSAPTRMIVVSDGDIARNKVNWRDESFSPLGYNEFEKYQFANKDFLINAIEYLLDENGVIEARGKEVKLRLLDTAKASAEKTKWQVVNIALPLVFMGLFGVIYHWRRKRKYAK
jgi:ABC-2 type transport system permease protein